MSYEQTKTIKWTKNIITQKRIYRRCYLHLRISNFLISGVFVIHLDEEIKDPQTYYDLFKLISAILYGHLAKQRDMKTIINDNKFYSSVLNSPIISYRELTESRSTYNDSALNLFRIDKHHHLELFLRDISYEFVNPYKDLISYLFIHPGEEKAYGFIHIKKDTS